MIYDLHEKFVAQDGALPSRAYYIPFSDDKNFGYDKTKSKEVTLLSKWKFSYFKNFTDDVINCTPETEITVPSCWQMIGYDGNQYLNKRYPFPYFPPKILKDIPCGVYGTELKVDDLTKNYYLNFDGVDSCFYLFVNGGYVGYSTVSHSHAEFDITDKLNIGNNELKVVVLKWCSGSYFEAQDKLRMSGIFRDVYVLCRPKDHIHDYKITTDVTKSAGVINISVDKQATVRLFDGKKLLEEQCGNELIFRIENAKLWNAEQPNLYRLVISYNGEFIEEKVGIRKIEIDNAVLKLNGVPIKFKGVNRHSMTVNGYVETYDDLLKDVLLMKKYNINAVRTSHYPPHPDFCKLCEEYGIYVLEEADVECHGILVAYFQNSNFNDMAKDETFKDIFIHRTMRMYERDKNRSSVVMWSLGNESGFADADYAYSNFNETAKWLKERDDRPTHYEGQFQQSVDWNFVRGDSLDTLSRMYPPFRDMDKLINGDYGYKHGVDMKPFVLCEYSHAMGNSCGDVKDYWKYVEENDFMAGGFIWEWMNQGVYEDNKFLYGGDFGEKMHDGPFCADGLVELDRSWVHSSLLEVSEVYSPIKFYYEEGVFYVRNKNAFADLSNYSATLSVKVNGITVSCNKIDIGNIPAGGAKQILIDVPFDIKRFTTVDLVATDTIYGGVNIEQIIFSNVYPIKNFNSAKIPDDFALTKDGMISRLQKNDCNYLYEPVKFNLFRAPLDNDITVLSKWKGAKLDDVTFRETERTYGVDSITVKGYIVTEYLYPTAAVTIVYRFGEDGEISIKINAKISDYVPFLPRFGLTFALPKEFKKVRYFGAGPEEAYEDKRLYAPVGLYENTVDKMFVHYVKPQENGSHVGSRMVELSSDKHKIRFESKRDFSFSVWQYKQDLPKHDFELEEADAIYVNIDYRMTGVGSQSCCHLDNIPFTYTFNEKDISFEFNVILDD